MGDRRTLYYGRQHIEDDDVAAVVSVLKSDFLTQGPVVERFEDAVAERVGAAFAVATANGTAALHIACLAAEIGPGDCGVTTTMTFVASANAIRYCGAEVALADMDPASLGLSPSAFAAQLAARPETSVVVTVDFAGLASASAEIRIAAGDRVIIEDACHAFGAAYENGSPVGCGAHADMTVFSFHPVKAITSAEGGMVTTNDAELHRRLVMLRNHGIEQDPRFFTARGADGGGERPEPWYYEHQSLGFNYRLSDLHAALGVAQLGKLDRFIARRREIVALYDDAFADLPAMTLYQSAAIERARSGLHLYVAGFDFDALGVSRTVFLELLARHQIRGQVHYIPVHRQPYYRDRYGLNAQEFPAAEAYYARCLSLPLHADLTDEEAMRVVTAVTETVTGLAA